MSALEARADPLDGFLRLVAAAERGEPEVALAARAEADARGSDDVGLGEQPIEEVPGAEAGRCLDPDVRGVLPAVDLIARRAEPVADDARVLHVKVDRCADFLAPLVGVAGGGAALDDVRDAVELGGLPPEPERMQAGRLAAGGTSLELFRHDGERAACAGEPRG